MGISRIWREKSSIKIKTISKKMKIVHQMKTRRMQIPLINQIQSRT